MATPPKASAAKQQPPLMPHATATWMVENTSLTFTQIAAFCQVHVLEVQAIADETAQTRLTPRDPVSSGELSLEEIEKGQADSSYRLKLSEGPVQQRRTSGPRYTPLAKRSDKPDGIAWIIKNHPEITDAQISKLIGTTKNTIISIRNREHWNIANIVPKDPVTLGLCAQRELDAIVEKIAKKAGIEPEEPNNLGEEREAMIAELEAERDSQAGEAEDTLRAAAESLFRSSGTSN